MIGSTQHQANDFAFFQVQTAKLQIFQRITREHMQRRIKAQNFLNQFGGDWPGDPALQHGFDAIAQRMHRGLMSSVQNENSGGDQLIFR